MSRPRAIAVVLALAGLLGLAFAWRRPVSAPSLECPDGGPVQLSPDGVASCQPEALTLHQKFDCNTATEADFALVTGVGPSLAQGLVAARGGGFGRWEEIDAVAGVGETRLNALKAACEIRVMDAGVW